MLAKKPEDRFQTGNDLIAALGGAVSDPSLTASSIAMLTSPGLMAPTERLPTPKPWSADRWRMLSRPRQAAYSLVGIAVFASALSVGLKFANVGQASGATPDSANGVALAGGSEKPVALPGATVTKMTPADSAALAPKAKVPSTRAQFILDYNKNPGNCPLMPDTLLSTKPISYELLVDSIPNRQWSDKMAVGYDVCGLGRQTPFNVAFNLSKKANRIGRGGKDLRVPPEAQLARTPRQRMRAVFDMEKEGMQPGDYRLEVILSGVRGKPPLTVTREFRILEKPL
jgi:hypothetical protein